MNCPSLSDNVIFFFLLSGLECGSIKDLTSEEEVVKALKTPLASMQYGMEDFLAKLVAQACSEFIPLLSPLTHTHTQRKGGRREERKRERGGGEGEGERETETVPVLLGFLVVFLSAALLFV